MEIHCLDLVASHLIDVSHLDLYWLSYLDESTSGRAYVLEEVSLVSIGYLCMISGDRLIKDDHLIRGVSPNGGSLSVDLVD